MRELDHVSESGKVAQFEVLVAWNVVSRAHGCEHLRLLDRIDAEVRLQVEIQVQHVFRVASLLCHDFKNCFLDRIIALLRRSRCGTKRDWLAGGD